MYKKRNERKKSYICGKQVICNLISDSMDKIVVASDSFKGSLTSLEVALSAEKGIREVFPQCNVVKVNVADGGEGTMDALYSTLGGQWVTVPAEDPLEDVLHPDSPCCLQCQFRNSPFHVLYLKDIPSDGICNPLLRGRCRYLFSLFHVFSRANLIYRDV